MEPPKPVKPITPKPDNSEKTVALTTGIDTLKATHFIANPVSSDTGVVSQTLNTGDHLTAVGTESSLSVLWTGENFATLAPTLKNISSNSSTTKTIEISGDQDLTLNRSGVSPFSMNTTTIDANALEHFYFASNAGNHEITFAADNRAQMLSTAAQNPGLKLLPLTTQTLSLAAWIITSKLNQYFC